MNTNHGYMVTASGDSFDWYKEVGDGWCSYPRCGFKPSVWIFDNGRSTSCGCKNNEYDKFEVKAESVMSVYSRCNGSVAEYDADLLRVNWNDYCLTMINPCNHYDLLILGRW